MSEVEYHIVSGYGDSNYPKPVFDAIAQEVGVLIEQGWRPQGGVSVAFSIGMIVVAQALLRDL